MKSQVGGGLWPVVQRELRETARRPLNHWLRLGGAAVGVLVFCYVTSNTPMTVVGAQLFRNIHLLLMYLICGLVPALTADCIASEKREGTIGLLFMTPLTASGIVLGKSLAQVLRALTLWLAVTPLLTIPFLYGGVTWGNVVAFLNIELCAGMMCLAAGLVASSLTENRAYAFILAFLLMAVLVGGPQRLPFSLWRMLSPGPVFTTATLYGSSYGPGPFVTVTTSTGAVLRVRVNGPATRLGGGFRPGILSANPRAMSFAFAALVLWAAIRFAGWRVERSWQDKIPSVRQQNWVRRYCTPLFARWFARGMRRTLEWNPIAWLQQYSWKSRVSKWGLCLLFVLLECYAIDGSNPYGLSQLLTILLLILAAAYTFAGVNGFFQEKKSGALELILVTPLSVNQIIFGRVWGLWKQFLPATLLLVGSDIAVNEMIPGAGLWVDRGRSLLIKDLEIAAIYVTLPVVATCFALIARNLFLASLITVLMVFTPDVVWLMISLGQQSVRPTVNQARSEDVALAFWVLVVHVWTAMFAYIHLRRRLESRRYAY
jgi:ABC-type transport system involved in multi-copper enzyme maturation permease subunit